MAPTHTHTLGALVHTHTLGALVRTHTTTPTTTHTHALPHTNTLPHALPHTLPHTLPYEYHPQTRLGGMESERELFMTKRARQTPEFQSAGLKSRAT